MFTFYTKIDMYNFYNVSFRLLLKFITQKKGYVPILFLMSDKYYNNFVSENKLIRELWLKN